jgi:heterodisulfide reductase subunit C
MERFKRFLMEQNLPRLARACYQCSACVGGCPVGQKYWDFNPRRLLEKILQNDFDEIIKDNKIWLCAACHTCLERCPQTVEVSEIMVQLKNAAARMGNIPEHAVKLSREVMKTGWVQNPAKRILRIRQELGLPEIPEGIRSSELRQMSNCLELKKNIESLKEIDTQIPEGSEDRPSTKEKEKKN